MTAGIFVRVCTLASPCTRVDVIGPAPTVTPATSVGHAWALALFQQQDLFGQVLRRSTEDGISGERSVQAPACFTETVRREGTVPTGDSQGPAAEQPPGVSRLLSELAHPRAAITESSSFVLGWRCLIPL